jgi:hypothetical protein
VIASLDHVRRRWEDGIAQRRAGSLSWAGAGLGFSAEAQDFAAKSMIRPSWRVSSQASETLEDRIRVMSRLLSRGRIATGKDYYSPSAPLRRMAETRAMGVIPFGGNCAR